MCAQCWATAATAVGGATGIRAWAAARRPRWLSEARLRVLTVSLLAIAVLIAGARVS
jgi:hypothetical protein